MALAPDFLDGGLIVSCQPVAGGPLDTVGSIVALALAARDGGARALRIEGAVNVAAVTRACDLPVIGIVKRDLEDSPVRITPYLQDVADLAAAGAAVIAVDATDRPRPVRTADLLATIRAAGALAMADLATLAEAEQARSLGFDIIGTTLSGYTGGAIPPDPDLALVTACRGLGGVVVAEGRYNNPESAARALRAGASAVCVGSAITRTEHVTGWFRSAIDRTSKGQRETVLTFDIGGTKTLAALVCNDKVLDRRIATTTGNVGSAGWLDRLRDMVQMWEGRYHRVGVAASGVIEDGHWSALNPVTLDVPERMPLQSALAARLGCPVLALNDAQAAAWGEYRFGAGQNLDMAFVTVSSGIGGGIVLGGRLLQGARGLAGSLGQIQGAPNALRLESRASGFAIAAAAGLVGQAADSRAVFAAADGGAPWAGRILTDMARFLASGLSDLQRLIDPDLIVVGGGVGMLAPFRTALDLALDEVTPRFRPKIVTAQLGADAGIIGIADHVAHS